MKFRRWWRSGFFIFAFYTFFFLIHLPDIYFYYDESSTAPSSLLAAFARLALTNYLWAIWTPLIFRVGDIFFVSRSKFWRNMLIHFIFGLIFGALNTFAFHLIIGLGEGLTLAKIHNDLFDSTLEFLHNVKNGFIYYIGIQTFNQAVNYSQKYQDREFSLQQAELKALKSQLNSHFLFNTLNAISALVYRSPEDADRTIMQLSDLLRISLEAGKSEEIPLREELDFLQAYLRIQQTLMNSRLKVEWKINRETLDAAVPNMILQPLVENSIEHGLAPLKHGGTIEIGAFHQNGALFLEVRDNGRGLTVKESNSQPETLLPNTRARLRFLYSDAQEVKLVGGEAGGVSVRIKIPFRQLSKSKAENKNEITNDYH